MRSLRLHACTASLLYQVRGVAQGRLFSAACDGLPRTPSGRNPYDVLELTLSPALEMNGIAKQYRQLVVMYHPDKPGGSTEKMSEINLAYKIVKEHHDSVVLKWTAAQESNASSRMNVRQAQSAHSTHSADYRQQTRKASPSFHAKAKPKRQLSEIISQWETLTKETEQSLQSICSRYEVAIEQAKFLRQSKTLNEIVARERWIRRCFMKSTWEVVHELRGELLRRGARSAQQSELAESMVVFASQAQRKLTNDFQRQTQNSVQHQARMLTERGLSMMVALILLIKMWKWMFKKRKATPPPLVATT